LAAGGKCLGENGGAYMSVTWISCFLLPLPKAQGNNRAPWLAFGKKVEEIRKQEIAEG